MYVHRSGSTLPTLTMGAVWQLAEVRARFVDWLSGAGVDQERIDDLSVVISELGANAIRETPEGAPPPQVAARLDGSTVEVVVSNEVSSDARSVDDWDLEDPLRTGGRGLLLVAAFVDDIQVDVVDRRLVVTCTAAL